MDAKTFHRLVMRSRPTMPSKVSFLLASEANQAWSHEGPVHIAMSGYQSRPGSHAIQLIDHDFPHEDPTATVRSVCGSVRSVNVRGSELHGIVEFAGDEESQLIRHEFDSGLRTKLMPFVHIVTGCQLRSGERWSDTITGPALIAVDWRLAYVLTSKAW